MTTLILARHAHSTYNEMGLYTGQADAPLSVAGQAQALQMAKLLEGVRIDAVYTSDLCRTGQTVAPTAAAHGLLPIADAGLREIDMGAFTGLAYAAVQERFPVEYAAFRADADTPAKGGESINGACARILAALTRSLAEIEGKTVFVCSHALTCRLVHALASGKTLACVMQSPVPANATPVYYRFTEGRFSPLDQ